MKIHFNVTWGKHQFFNAGIRDFTLEWKQGLPIPRKGDAIAVSTFIGENYTADEMFKHRKEFMNVFDWIQNTRGWELEKLEWMFKNGAVEVRILVTDKW